MNDVDELLAQAEKCVLTLASRARKIGALDIHDIEQELRMEVWRLALRFDPDKAQWKTYIWRVLPLRAKDLWRKHGHDTRHGKPRRVDDFAGSLDSMVDENGRHCVQIEDSHDDLGAIEWEELKRKCATESLAVRAILLRCEGHSMKDVGKQLKVSESRVSVAISETNRQSDRRDAIKRLQALTRAAALLFLFSWMVPASDAIASSWEDPNVTAALRMYDPGDESDPMDITLRDCFLEHLHPLIFRARARSTTTQYFTALDHWERFLEQRASTRSTRAQTLPQQTAATLPVSQISDSILNEFGVWLMADNGAQLSIDSAGKQWKKIRAILRKVGPRESGNPSALCLLPRVPAMSPLSDLVEQLGDEDAGGPADVTDEQIGRIYDACEVAAWPSEVPQLQWRTFLVIGSVLGPRVNDCATLSADNFRLQPESPVARSVRSSDHGWLIYQPTKTKRKKRSRLIVPLPPCVRIHVDELLRRRGGNLFQWTDSKGHRFRDEWSKIVSQAGLEHVRRQHLRSTANIRWTRAGMGEDLGRWVLGHAARDVNDAHYMRAEPSLIEAAPLVQVPAQFQTAPSGQTQTFFEFG